MHGTMKYMENYFDMRVDPTKLVPGAKSVITMLLNYFPYQQQLPHAPSISKYAWGKDYHDVIREKLNKFLARINEKIGSVNGRGFVDSAPVLERTWASRSGPGGRRTNGDRLTQNSGSVFSGATLIAQLERNYDDRFAGDFYGTCTTCIDACRTVAILPDRVINGSRCIS